MNSETTAPGTLGTLQALIDEVDGFLASWSQRFRHESQLFQSQSTIPLFQERIDEFEQEKRQWEAMRQREAERVKEISDHLTAAWLQLEAEQQRFFEFKQLHGAAVPQSAALRDLEESAAGWNESLFSDDDEPPSHLTNIDDSLRTHPASNARPATSCAHSRETAVRQFHRLRQEVGSMRSHAQHDRDCAGP